ncbi:hypothetical protein WJX73_007446 [Symbiochloris irregularis]|uniref:WD repeat-containing protein 19 n=1 Tax=Symbiochloris irregularis TaxID=706552 RepID=A0AAW1NMF7_9CHLO
MPLKELFTLGNLGSRSAHFSGSVIDEIAISDAEPPEADHQAPVVALEWDCESRMLAVQLQNQAFPCLYDVVTKQLSRVDIGLQGHTVEWIGWSRCTDTLAIATSLGSLLLMRATCPGETVPKPKHSGRITCGAWNSGRFLALAAEDKQVTVTDVITGATVKTVTFGLDPQAVAFASQNCVGEPDVNLDQLVSVSIGSRTLYIFEVEKTGYLGGNNGAIELAFQPSYGTMAHHLWLDKGHLLVGFQTGIVLMVSTATGEVSKELHSAQYFPSAILAMAFNPMVGRACIAGGGRVEVLELGDEVQAIPEEALDFDPSIVSQLEWTSDGQMLTVATQAGAVSVWLTASPQTSAAWGPRIAYLTSLRQVTIIDTTDPDWQCGFDTQEEPTLLALSDHLVAMACGNQVWCLRMVGGAQRPQAVVCHEQAHGDDITGLAVSSTFLTVLTAGILTMHSVSESSGGSIQVPLSAVPSGITTMAMVERGPDTLVVGSHSGRLLQIECETGNILRDTQHSYAIRQVHPDPHGNRVIVEDEVGQALLWAANGQCLPIPEFAGPLETALWDAGDTPVFLLSDVMSLCIYAHFPDTLAGQELRVLATQAGPSGSPPLLLQQGTVTFLDDHGTLQSFLLESHCLLQDSANGRATSDRFAAEMGLGHLKEATQSATSLKDADAWRELAEAAVHLKNVELAAKCYEAAGDMVAVQALFPLLKEADKEVVAGQLVLLLNQDFEAAEAHFLRSGRPEMALDMHKQAGHTQRALELAHDLDASQVLTLSFQRAQELEAVEDWQAAQQLYEDCRQSQHAGAMTEALAKGCTAGLAKCAVRQGEVAYGMQLAKGSGDAALCCQCAKILEGLNQLQAAAELYEAGGDMDAAVVLFIRAKAFSSAQRVLPRTSSSASTAIQLARAHEAEGQYEEALKAYRTAGDFESVIRLYLGPLGRAQEAAELARHSGKPPVLALVARSHLDRGDPQGAMEFYLLAKQTQEAFAVAEQHNMVEQYLRAVGSEASPQDLARAVQVLEGRGDFERAGDLYRSMGDLGSATTMYIKGGKLSRALDLGEASDEPATQQALRKHLTLVNSGAAPGLPPLDLLRLRLASGCADEAAAAAVTTATGLQQAGDYKGAHAELCASWRCFAQRNVALPPSAMRLLVVLHSYILVRPLVKLGLHENAARMLVRVANELELFQPHAAAVLTSAVVECHRAGMGATAYTHAARLIKQPELKAAINPAYKRKIEGLVRRREMNADVEEAVAPCLHCGVPGPESQLECASCHRFIPFCLASGKRMNLGDWGRCGSCHMPARSSALAAFEGPCTICGGALGAPSAQAVANPQAHLAALSGRRDRVLKGVTHSLAAFGL